MHRINVRQNTVYSNTVSINVRQNTVCSNTVSINVRQNTVYSNTVSEQPNNKIKTEGKIISMYRVGGGWQQEW